MRLGSLGFGGCRPTLKPLGSKSKATRKTCKQDAMDHTEGTFTGFRGLELYYQRWWPEGEAKAVLVIGHGFGEHGGRYRNVVNRFVTRGYAVYAFDLRGSGRSRGQRGHVNAFAEFREDVKAFLQLVRSQEAGWLPSGREAPGRGSAVPHPLRTSVSIGKDNFSRCPGHVRSRQRFCHLFLAAEVLQA